MHRSAPGTRRSRNPSSRAPRSCWAPPIYTCLNGKGALRLYQQGNDDVSHAAISGLALDWSPGASRSRRRQATGRQVGWRAFRLRTGQARRHGASGMPACNAPGQLVPYGAGPRDHTGRIQEHPARLRWQIRCRIDMVHGSRCEAVRAGGPARSRRLRTDVRYPAISSCKAQCLRRVPGAGTWTSRPATSRSGQTCL